MAPYPAVSAHRRDAAGLTGLQDAARSGADYVEIDVRRTGDGALVVHHDPTVGGLPLARLAHDRAVSLADNEIPLVSEAMEIIAGHARGHLDLKERGCETELVEMAEAAFGPDGFVVTTRDPASIKQIKAGFPHVRVAISVGRSLWERGAHRDFAPVRAIRASGADLVALNHRLARVGVLTQIARAGFPAMIWTVNDEPQMRRFLADGRVEVLITDHPRQALALRASLSQSRPTSLA
ncbi:glycerophosphodiester phosphodiesterase [Actinomadura rupiterrae]|uniref:glycerophosphodiester phosphodiesterase n=1 Tax=Actinomadura rupiterrae TaxID=559627 RepID=UPI0020A28EC6|nr:glycerophosphodiester phosphodiesterase [Actinomadura rupiterrae]MCP2336494.1 glycerophosphoryl diester phosphodiesterase [Actinomadura rupiterrae]